MDLKQAEFVPHGDDDANDDDYHKNSFLFSIKDLNLWYWGILKILETYININVKSKSGNEKDISS